jgi:hypothetical protein
LRTRLKELARAVHSEKLGETATEFDSVHSVHRALRVGSVHEMIPPSRLRPRLIEAIEEGLQATDIPAGYERSIADRSAEPALAACSGDGTALAGMPKRR